MPLDSNRLLSKVKYLLLHPDDVADIQAALLERWPGLLFLGAKEHLGWIPTAAGTHLKQWKAPVFERVDSLYVPGIWSMYVLLAPAGWGPVWREEENAGLPGQKGWTIANQPPEYFVFEASSFGWPDKHNAEWGRIWAWYNAKEPEHLKFLNAVWRVFERFVVRTVDSVYDDTGRVRTDGFKGDLRVGYHALEWARADPQRRLEHHYRPAGSPGAPLPREHWMARACEHPEQAKDFERWSEAVNSLKAYVVEKERRRAAKKSAS